MRWRNDESRGKRIKWGKDKWRERRTWRVRVAEWERKFPPFRRKRCFFDGAIFFDCWTDPFTVRTWARAGSGWASVAAHDAKCGISVRDFPYSLSIKRWEKNGKILAKALGDKLKEARQFGFKRKEDIEEKRKDLSKEKQLPGWIAVEVRWLGIE